MLTAAGGPEALDLVQQAVRPFDVLVTDIVMPQMSGQQLADILLLRQPTLKVLFISGYSDLPRKHDGMLRPGMALLTKPFTPGQLVQRVRALLDVNPAGPGRPTCRCHSNRGRDELAELKLSPSGTVALAPGTYGQA